MRRFRKMLLKAGMKGPPMRRFRKMPLTAILLSVLLAAAPVFGSPSGASPGGASHSDASHGDAPHSGGVEFAFIDEIAPGDRCTGLSVFHGTEIEEFELEILGVVRDVSPGSDLILARAEGELLENTGIMQGMSGSPVYKGGRLIGAIASAWSFCKEPIAGITPIEEMLRAYDMLDEMPASTDTPGHAAGPAFDRITGGEVRRSRVAWVSKATGIGTGGDPERLPRSSTARIPETVLSEIGVPADSAELAPLNLPLFVSGHDPLFLEGARGVLSGLSLTPVAGGTSEGGSGSEEGAAELLPGSSVGIQLVRGDVNMTATGTVTHRDGDRVLAFGHPMFHAGSVELPMVGAFVHTTMPMLSVSYKFASGTDLVGTFYQDRRRMVAGRLGSAPKMLPLAVTVRGSAGVVHEFGFEVLRSPAYASLFSSLAVANAISEVTKSAGPADVTLRIHIVTDEGEIDYANHFCSETPAFRSAGELATLMDVLLLNEFERREIERIELEVELDETRRWAAIERVNADRTVYAPGDIVRISVVLRDWQKGLTERTLELHVPESEQEGQLFLWVGGAQEYHDWESSRLGDGLVPRSYSQLADLIDRSRSEDTVVAQLLSPKPGLSLSGDELRGVPGRAVLAMASVAASGAAARSEMTVLAQDEFTHDRSVIGVHQIQLTVRTER
jgi:hypothetical protein